MNKTLWSKEVFARNLKHYMEHAGKTQKEMADIVGVSAPTFNEWIKAKKYPRIDKIEILANYFGILKSDLIEEKDLSDTQKNNNTITDIIVRLESDPDFLAVVETLYGLDNTKIAGVQQMLLAFQK